MRKRILALLLCTVLLLSTGCAAKAKTFSAKDFTITLTEDFQETAYDTYDASYQSDSMAVYVLRQEFELFEGGDVEVDLEFFTEYMISVHNLDVEPQTKDRLFYFVFEKEVNSNTFTYYAFAYEANDAFWLVQFCCETKNVEKLEKSIFQYAKSVKV